MKRKIILYTIALTAFLLSACSREYTNGAESTSPTDTTQNTTTQSTATQSTTTQDITLQDTTAQASDSETTMISEEEAKRIALSHAELTTEQAIFIKSGIDRDNGRKNYDIEFYTQDQKEYDYEIDPYTGEILDYDFDAEYYIPTPGTAEGQELTADTAKQIALAQVPGATLENLREFQSDYDNGRLQYEGKIYFEQAEYEFEIDGNSGDILEWDVEPIYGVVSY